MNIETAKSLIKLNHTFYQTIGKYFDSSRNYFWPGWKRLKPILQITNYKFQKTQQYRVLDLGCGNARFAEFLFKECDLKDFSYEGLDYSELLIEKAQERISKLQLPNSKVDNVDLLFGNWDLRFQVYDLIVMFGVMHHIPSLELRKRILEKTADLLNEQSIFVVTFWKFKDISRLERRILDNSSKEYTQVLNSVNIKPEELEKGDYILDWERGMRAYRYCHYYTTEDARNLLEGCGFEILEEYKADAKEDIVNEYMICRKKH